MIPYIIGVILLIMTLLIVGLIFRKRIYETVDRQEIWKMEIMNRNTASELARIKGLNLSGETQEKFESWKERWEFIVASELPDISELLFEAEDAADRYRFPTAQKVIQEVETTLSTIEKDIERMLAELEELLESEQTSRKEIEILQSKLKEQQQNISQNQNKYGKARQRFSEVLQEIEKGPSIYDELVEAGNYLEAKSFVDQLKEDFNNIENEIKEFPGLLEKCAQTLPRQLDDLSSGLQTMENDGYRVEHLGFKREIHNYQQRLLDAIQALEKEASADVKVIISETEERITEMYDQLEQEAVAKNYIEAQLSGYEQSLEELSITFSETKAEVEILRKTYYFEDQNMESYLSLEKSITRAQDELAQIKTDLLDKEKAHSNLRMQLEQSIKQLKELKDDHHAFKELTKKLRKDELKAREKLTKIRRQVSDLKRRLKQSNLPGVPSFISDILEAAANDNHLVIKALEKQPLDMGAVNHALETAEATIDRAVEQIEIMLDQAYLTEQVIQYANRYRSKYPLLAAQLLESERLFRAFEYELSLEHAAQAIEEIEPGALKKIEANQMAMLN